MKIREFVAQIDEFGTDDGGVASFTFQVQSLKKDKVYKEHQHYDEKKGNLPSGYIIDDNSCWQKIGTVDFNKKFKES